MGDLSWSDTADSDDADRGFLGALRPAVVKGADGTVVWDGDAYAFLAQPCPETASASLWRQGRLHARQGLYQVTDGIYQVRGLDISNMSLIEGDEGVIVVDPLASVETATAALALYRKHRGDRPVTGVIYTSSHRDHFGGVAGVTGGAVPIVAATGFMQHAVAENVYAGTAISRRAGYLYGQALPPGPAGHVGAGLGLAASTGSVSLLPPTVEITHPGQHEIVDGVGLAFQLPPGAGTPSEMSFLIAQRRALYLAQDATFNLHSLLTPGGAAAPGARAWSGYLAEALTMFAGRADVMFAAHHWPTWGADRVALLLSQRRDLYAYLHDQTLRLLNRGHTGAEIAEMIQLPPALAAAVNARGQQVWVSHHIKAIYHHYLGWFDGNPASLWPHPPVETARRYVECFGGVQALLDKARGYASSDPRFAAALLQHAVFAAPDNAAAKELLARVYETLGYGAQNGAWRSIYLTGAQELRHGIAKAAADPGPGMASALPVQRIFDSLAIRVDAPNAWHETISIDWNVTDSGQRIRTTLRHGVLLQEQDPCSGEADLTLKLTKSQLLSMLAGEELDGVPLEGDPRVLKRLLSHLDDAEPGFAVVTP